MIQRFLGPTSFGPLFIAMIALTGCETTAVPQSRQVIYPGQAPQGQGRSVQIGSISNGALVPVSSSGQQSAESSPTGAELAAVTQILTQLQFDSFAANAEHCGYIGLNYAGQIIASTINRGTEASCQLPIIPPQMTPLASFHTHSTYSPYYASEFPTSTDMQSDIAENVDGYISTPGGRLWYVDSDTRTVRELCGRGCLPQDPNYRPEDDGPLRPVMTLAYLERLERG